MLGSRNLVLDTFCEVYTELKPYADAEFWNLEEHIAAGELIPGAIYLLGRQQFGVNIALIQQLVKQQRIQIILSNPAEGSATLRDHVVMFGVEDLVKSCQVLLIGGGDMASEWPCLQYDSFLPKILDYEENIQAISHCEKIYTKLDKPYKFLFLNGRTRSHRKYLRESFSLSGLLDQSLWTWLDTTVGDSRDIQLIHNNKDLLLQPNTVKYLPPEYEINKYHAHLDQPCDSSFVKHQLFGNEWGEIHLTPAPYVDTYFSLVTETVFTYPYSFRTEKIWKPVAMAHPWIAVANRGYYRDIKNLGFKTFGHVIDESFDLIDNHQDRINRIAEIVKDLCTQDLAKFLQSCYNVCKYNQQHLSLMRTQVRNEFPRRFQQFVTTYSNE
jgi:hypothetical protein